MTFYLETVHPIADDSPDHIQPRATARDNSKNPRFNQRLAGVFLGKLPSVLDLGCAGGGLVRTLLDDGFVAVGLEGSDYNLKAQRAEWAVIPESLFTCDVSRPFTLHTGDFAPYQFDVVTAWEFIEHIPEERLGVLLDNITRHMKPGGYLIGSTSDSGSKWQGIEHHLTRKPMTWWDALFRAAGFKRSLYLETHFETANAWVRSVKYNFVYELVKNER